MTARPKRLCRRDGDQPPPTASRLRVMSASGALSRPQCSGSTAISASKAAFSSASFASALASSAAISRRSSWCTVLRSSARYPDSQAQ